MLHGSLQVINNGLAFAYVNMHSPAQEITEGLADLKMYQQGPSVVPGPGAG